MADKPSAPRQPPRAVYVYSGPGAGVRSAGSAIEALRASLGRARVDTLSADALVDGAWAADAALLVIPGGADLPYCRELNGKGNAIIRDYVSGGGAYLGLCAGAYYACAAVEFEPGSPCVVGVRGPRELALFPGPALGAAVPGFEYESEAGAAAAPLLSRRVATDREEGGGGAARGARTVPDPGRGDEGRPADQDTPGVAWDACVDYCNGGPVFVAPGGGRLPDAGVVGGVEVKVLARYAASPVPARAGPPPPEGSAPAAAAEGGAAAVVARVGDGVVVLCGTHPELAPAGRWLQGGGPGADALAATLDACPARTEFWESLLDEAGVGWLKERGRVGGKEGGDEAGGGSTGRAP